MKETKKIVDELLNGEFKLNSFTDKIIEIADDASATDYLNTLASENDPQIQEYLVCSRRNEYAQQMLNDYGAFIPASAHAANDGHNLCDFECEIFIMKEFGAQVDKLQMSKESKRNYWLRSAGTPLFNMGKLLELNGFYVNRTYNETLSSLCETLKDHKVIVVVNDDVLSGKTPDIFADGFNFDDCPNHAVVVLGVDKTSASVNIFNPADQQSSTVYPLDDFLAAWKESKNYMVSVRQKTNKWEYNPQPIDTSSVSLNTELLDLVEFLSENAHDVWASGKFEKGYTYGPDDASHNHFLKPYHMLTEQEKDQDRENVLATIKVLKRLGYRLVNVNNMHRCPHCGEAIEPNNNFCPSCGRELTWKDFA